MDRFTSVFCSRCLLQVLLLDTFAQHVSFISVSCWYHLMGGVSLVGDCKVVTMVLFDNVSCGFLVQNKYDAQ